MFEKWPWKIYGVLLTSIVTHDVIAFLSPDSELRTYYTILIAFNKLYFIPLLLNILSMVINCLVPIVVFYYAFNMSSDKKFWKIFLFVRIFFDLTGHFYSLQLIKSAYFQSPTYALACIGILLIPILPSYIAHYSYIFKELKK